MMDQKVYLKQNALSEPLFNQWYAWSNLIAPQTAAMYMANLHSKIMQSFISSPQVHMAAVKNPEMMGGPFMTYDSSKAESVRALLEKTLKDNAEMFELAKAIQTLDAMLTSEASGFSLDLFYRKVPKVLRGYVELVYDLNNFPSVRFIEGLFYKSRYYRESSQGIALSLISSDDRPFVFSTPRLEDDGALRLDIAFRDERLDELYKMKEVAQGYNRIKDVLGIAKEDEGRFATFFTQEAPNNSRQESGDSVRVRYFGHACVLVQTGDTSILCDPVISYEISDGIKRYTYRDLPESIDCVLITHNHQDHCMFETLLQLRHKIKAVIVPKSNSGALIDPSLKLILKAIGFKNVYEIDEMETVTVGDAAITGLPFLGEHADHNIRSKIEYVIAMRNKKILCAADSNNIEPQMYDHIHESVGDLDALFLGMECDGAPLTWIYGPLLTKPLARKMDQSRRFNGSDYERGIEIVNRLHPKQVYVYAMGQEPWLTHLTAIRYTEQSRPIVESNKLVEECLGRGIISERLFGQKELFI